MYRYRLLNDLSFNLYLYIVSSTSCIVTISEKVPSVVATTHWNGTCSMLTLAKLLVGYPVVGIIRELNKEPSLY